MRIKRKNGLKMIVIALVLLLCLALAVGITGAYYQAKRQATGTLNMDQGIVIDYKGFNKGDENIWQREKESTFLLFSETNAQPGEHIAVNAAGIRANAKSVDFYARVKLSYKFYNVVKATEEGGKDTETEVTLAAPGSLITTSANFFGTNWVDGGSTDGYYYYATGTTLNKFTKTDTAFVDLFATDAEFIIEGEGFKGSNDLEGGGFVVGDTSINKIEVYLTLETLQGDVETDELNTMGWKIASEVDFAKVDEGKIVKSNTTTEVTDEKLNVTINDKTTSLETVKFPYDEEVTLKFDTRNVDYITLKYSTGNEETFGLAAEDFANDYLSETALKVTAKSSKGTVKGYTVGLWDSEYTGFIYSTTNSYEEEYIDESGDTHYRYVRYPVEGGIACSGYYGSDTEITIKNSARVRQREMKYVLKYNSYSECVGQLSGLYSSFIYPISITTDSGYTETINNEDEFMVYAQKIPDSDYVFPTSIYKDGMTITSSMLVTTTFGGKTFDVKEIGYGAFVDRDFIKKVTIQEGIVYIGGGAFSFSTSSDNVQGVEEIILPSSLTEIGELAFAGTALKSIILPNSITSIGESAFYYCKNLASITISNSLTIIQKGLFEGCNSLTAIIIPDSVTSIGDNAFYKCGSLEEVSIGSGVMSIGASIFRSCGNLTSIIVDASNTAYHSVDNCLIETVSKTLIAGCKNSIIPIDGSVTSIGNGAFDGCSGLISITIPDNVISIGEYAFSDCKNLTTINLGNGITNIGEQTFSYCTSLISITIPSSVTSISHDAFQGCSNLTTTIGDLGGTWVDSNGRELAANTLLTDGNNIRRTA